MTYSINKVSGVVILYNSPLEVINNIITYRCQVNKLYVIDNSYEPDNELVSKILEFENVQYIPNNDNLGIGYALNLAANKSIQDGYSFLLTMDDDSKAPANLVQTMLTFLSTQSTRSIGIVSVNHSKKQFSSDSMDVLYTMTSGNLLILNVFRQVGPFDKRLFIDHVDHEYCMRLNSKGFKVVELPSLHLVHQLGVSKEIRVFNRLFTYVSHSPQRMYYMVRNGIYVAGKYSVVYPGFVLTVFRLITKELIKIIAFEDSKLQRFSYMLRGIKDGLFKRLNRLERGSK